jgi:hypothetical protein
MKMTSKKLILLLLLLVGIIATAVFFFNKSQSASAYIRWVRDVKNGLNDSEKTALFSYSLQYRSATFMALTELSGEEKIDKKRIDSVFWPLLASV